MATVAIPDTVLDELVSICGADHVFSGRSARFNRARVPSPFPVHRWEDFVPDGKETDFRRAVAAREGEKIVFTWQVWPDRESFFAAETRMHFGA